SRMVYSFLHSSRTARRLILFFKFCLSSIPTYFPFHWRQLHESDCSPSPLKVLRSLSNSFTLLITSLFRTGFLMKMSAPSPWDHTSSLEESEAVNMIRGILLYFTFS